MAKTIEARSVKTAVALREVLARSMTVEQRMAVALEQTRGLNSVLRELVDDAERAATQAARTAKRSES